MYCKHCGKEVASDAAFCSGCGKPLSDAQWTRQPQSQNQSPVINVVNTNVNNGYLYQQKSKWIAFFLCLFLGELGFHRFYVGKIGTGIIWLFTLGLFGIGWLVDLIMILCGAFRDKAGQLLRG